MRIIAFDYLKGIAIFLVVWCHCIQYIFGETFDNTFYSIIYSFHMPLFMIISGYLSSKKTDDSIITLAVAKFRRLIIPNISWGSIVLIASAILTFIPPVCCPLLDCLSRAGSYHLCFVVLLHMLLPIRLELRIM